MPYILYWMMVVLVLMSTMVQAQVVIYGLDEAQQYSAENGPENYYIQVSSFKNQSNALRYRQYLQAKTLYPVVIKSKPFFLPPIYAVWVGPIPSVYEVKRVAAVLNEPHEQRQLKIHKPNAAQRPTGNWYLSVGGGGQYPLGMDTLQVNNGSDFSPPYSMDLYSIQTGNSGVFALVAGRSWQQDKPYLPRYALGLMWQHMFKSQLNGQVTQYSDPLFTNYDYQLNVQSDAILAYGKVNVFQWKRMAPYLNIGLGGSINQVSNYNETALSGVNSRVSPGFQNNSASQFAYLLGAGIDLFATEQWSFSAGYNYVNLGSVSSGFGLSTWSGEKLNLGSNATNEFLLTLNFQFDDVRFYRG